MDEALLCRDDGERKARLNKILNLLAEALRAMWERINDIKNLHGVGV